MTYSCKDLCVLKFSAVPQLRGTLQRKLYAAGMRFCSSCSVKYLESNGIRCPCCNGVMKSHIRDSKI